MALRLFSRTARPFTVAHAPCTLSATRYITPISFRTLTTESATSTSQPTIVASPKAPAQLDSQAATPSSTTPTQPAQTLPYYVGRNRMNNVAVYERRDRGGSLKKTLLKKAEGNLQALRFDVAEALGLTEREVKVNSVTNHIEIKGHRRDDVVLFLRNLGF